MPVRPPAPAPLQLALPHIQQLRAYTPGLQPTEPGWVKLNTNENPYPPSPRVIEALRQEIGDSGERLRLYPHPTSQPLRRQVAALHGLDESQVIVGNGSDDILNLLVRVFAGADAATGWTLPSYSLYPVLVAIQGGHLETIEFDRSMRLPVDRIAASGARLFFLTSPNAPTGVGCSNEELDALLQRFSGILVVDEAYAPFAHEDAVPLVARHPHLVVVRTLSKAYALAGIRVGYALGDPAVIDLLDRVRDSYNVDRLAQVAAAAALADAGYYEDVIRRIVRTRDQWAAIWRERRGWFIYPSAANFLFVEPRDAAGRTGRDVAGSLYEFLASRRILVRAFPAHPLTAPFLRISVGTEDDMLAVDAAVEDWTA